MRFNKYVYQVGDTYYDIRGIWSISRLTVSNDNVNAKFSVNGQPYVFHIGLSYLSKEYREQGFNDNQTVKEYKELLKAWMNVKGNE